MVIEKKAGHKEMVLTLLASVVAFLALVFVQQAVYWFDNFYLAFGIAFVLIIGYVVMTSIAFFRSFKRHFQFFDRIIIYLSIPLSLCFFVFMYLMTVMWLS